MLDKKIYKEKVRNCFLGKIIAGGIGAPYEGHPYPLNLKTEDAIIDMSPNDDLELQLVWLVWMEKYKMSLTCEKLSEAWLSVIKYGMDEYGVAIRNLKRGIKPPFTGAIDNYYTDQMGAAIRSEIWACLFPGQPDIAGYFAEQDSSVDHCNEGVWAEIFIARLESEAFVNNDLMHVIDKALEAIPESSKVTTVIKFVLDLHKNNTPLPEIRQIIMDNFGSHSFTDVIMNMAFMFTALLYGKGDFIKTILIAVNFGMDTDCTAATCGSIFTLIHGIDRIPEKFIKQVNTEINVNEFFKKIDIPKNVNELIDRVVALQAELAEQLKGKAYSFPAYEPCVVPEGMNKINNEWLLVKGEDLAELKEIEDALKSNKPILKKDNIFKLKTGNLNLDLSDYCDSSESIFMYTKLSTDQDIKGQLMACSNTGLTAWLDDEQIINCHSRRKQIPSFHRTEGGATIPMTFKSGKEYLLKVKLYHCVKGVEMSTAFGDMNNQFIDIDFKI